MKIKRDRAIEFEIAQISRILNIRDNICQKYVSCCECPLSKLEVFETRTCDEIDKLAKRLELAYRVVETL